MSKRFWVTREEVYSALTQILVSIDSTWVHIPYDSFSLLGCLSSLLVLQEYLYHTLRN